MCVCVCVIDLDFLSGASGHFRDSGKVRRDNFVWSIQVTKFQMSVVLNCSCGVVRGVESGCFLG